MRIVEQTSAGIDKDTIGPGNLLPQSRCRGIVWEVLGTVFESESFVGSARISGSEYIILVQQLVAVALLPMD